MISNEEKRRVAELARRAQTGDNSALADLLTELESLIRSTLAGIVGRDMYGSDVDEMHQEVCVRVWKYLHKADPMKIGGWVTVISQKVGYAWVSRKANPRKKDLPTSPIDVYDNLYLSTPPTQGEQSLIKHALDKLPEVYRKCIYSQFILGQSEREQGRDEGVVGGTINWRRSKALAAAREILEKERCDG